MFSEVICLNLTLNRLMLKWVWCRTGTELLETQQIVWLCLVDQPDLRQRRIKTATFNLKFYEQWWMNGPKGKTQWGVIDERPSGPACQDVWQKRKKMTGVARPWWIVVPNQRCIHQFSITVFGQWDGVSPLSKIWTRILNHLYSYLRKAEFRVCINLKAMTAQKKSWPRILWPQLQISEPLTARRLRVQFLDPGAFQFGVN